MELVENRSPRTGKFFIIAIDDDPETLDTLLSHIPNDRIEFLTAFDGEQGLRLIREKKPDLVILDITIPRLNGLEICQILRRDKRFVNLPIILLSGRGLDLDRIRGLEMGADDYVTKPFNARELLLRIDGILRRVYGRSLQRDRLTLGDLTIDFGAHQVFVGKRSVPLTLTEFRLLAVLALNTGRVKSRQSLLDEIWDHSEDVFSRTVDTHIQRLRNKLQEAGRYIETVRGIGYRFQLESS